MVDDRHLKMRGVDGGADLPGAVVEGIDQLGGGFRTARRRSDPADVVLPRRPVASVKVVAAIAAKRRRPEVSACDPLG